MNLEDAMRIEPLHIQIIANTAKAHEAQLRVVKAFILAMNPLNPFTWLIYALSVVVTALVVVPKDRQGKYQWSKSRWYALLPCFIAAMLVHHMAVTHGAFDAYY